MTGLSCFKSYDVRGQLGVNLDAGICERIGRATAQVLAPGTAVTGRDIRESSPALQAALIDGLRAGGADVIDIGLCGTEEVYFATDHYGAGAGLMDTLPRFDLERPGTLDAALASRASRVPSAPARAGASTFTAAASPDASSRAR